MKNHLVGVFHGVSDYPKFCGLIEEAANLVPHGQIFAGDNLFTFSRNLGFLDDEKFTAAFEAAAETIVEKSLAWRYYVLTWAAHRALAIDGDFVECACYKGTGARIVADYVDFGRSAKSYYLYDLFESDESSPNLPQSEHGPDLAARVEARFAAEPNICVIKGEVPAILAERAPDRVAFLHLDLNNAAAEIAAMDFFWDRIAPGGSIVLDDYGWYGYRDQHVRERAWFAERGLMVLELPTGQGLVIK